MKKLTYEFVREQFEEEGYKLLSTNYINSDEYLFYLCPNNHKHKIRWYNWKSGKRCPFCLGQNRPNTFFVKNILSEEGYILVSEYVNNYTKLDVICSNGHLSSINWRDWCRGVRCKKCSFSKERHWNWKGGISKLPYCPNWTEEYKEEIKERDGYQCLNPYCYHTTDRLSVHHIDYTKTLCGPGNLITVCRGCNTRANKDREWHTEWYRTILNRRYGYEY